MSIAVAKQGVVWVEAALRLSSKAPFQPKEHYEV